MKRIIFIVCFLLSFAISASAECNVKFVGGRVEISGNVENAGAGENVTAVVLNKDFSSEDFFGGMDLFEKIHTFWQTETDENGSYTMSVPMKSDVEYGQYTVIVDSDKMTSAYETTIDAVGISIIEEVVKEVKKGENLKQTLLDNSDVLGIDTERYSQMSDSDVKIINDALIKINYSDDVYSNIAEIQNVFSRYMMLVDYCNAGTESEIIAIIDNPAFGIDTFVYDKLDKAAFAGTLLGGKYTDYDVLSDDFIKKSIVRAFNEPLIAGSLKEITEKYSALIDIDVSSGSSYKSVNSSMLYKEMMKNTNYESLEDIRSAMLKAIAKLTDKGGSGGSGGTGGGGGSSDKKPVTSGITYVSGTNNSNEVKDDENKTNKEDKCQFVDIENHWAKDEIIEMYEKGFVSGKTSVSFEPESRITRAEFTAIVSRVLKLNGTPSGYKDIDSGAWYADYVGGAQKAGIISSDTDFRPDDNITRQEIFKILVNAYVYCGGKITETEFDFADASEADNWAAEYIAKAVSIGIVQGEEEEDKLFIRPTQNATRAQAAAMIGRLSKLL